MPPTHHLTIWQANWAAEVEKATGGRVKFTSLPKAPAAPPGTFDAVRDGLVDLSYVTASYTPARHILPLMAELPGAGDTAEINSVAFSRIHWKHFQKVGEYKGVKLLGGLDPRPGADVHQEADQVARRLQGHEDPHRRRHRRSRWPTRSAPRPFVKPAPESYELLELRRRRRRVLPARVDRLVQARHGDRARRRCFPGGLYSSSFGFFMNEDKWNKLVEAGPGDHREARRRVRRAQQRPVLGHAPTRSACDALQRRRRQRS